MPPEEWVLLRVSGRLKSIVKHSIWGLGKMARCIMIYTSYDVFVQGIACWRLR